MDREVGARAISSPRGKSNGVQAPCLCISRTPSIERGCIEGPREKARVPTLPARGVTILH